MRGIGGRALLPAQGARAQAEWTPRNGGLVPGTRELRGLGVETLQDVQARRPGELGAALRAGAGLDGGALLRLLSHTGGDGFAWAEGAVRGSVAQALGRRTVVEPRPEEPAVRSGSGG